jgi:hypothetical protein
MLIVHVPLHIGPRLRQEFVVAVAPLGEQSHRFERPVGIAMNVLRQIFGE